MIIYHRGGRSDTRSGLYRIFQYKGIELVWVFLHFGSGSGIYFMFGFGYLNFEEKKLINHCLSFFVFKIYFNLTVFKKILKD